MINFLNEKNDRLNIKLQKLIPYIDLYNEPIIRLYYLIFGILVKISGSNFLLDESKLNCHLILKKLILSCDKIKIELALNLL